MLVSSNHGVLHHSNLHHNTFQVMMVLSLTQSSKKVMPLQTVMTLLWVRTTSMVHWLTWRQLLKPSMQWEFQRLLTGFQTKSTTFQVMKWLLQLVSITMVKLKMGQSSTIASMPLKHVPLVMTTKVNMVVPSLMNWNVSTHKSLTVFKSLTVNVWQLTRRLRSGLRSTWMVLTFLTVVQSTCLRMVSTVTTVQMEVRLAFQKLSEATNQLMVITKTVMVVVNLKNVSSL